MLCEVVAGEFEANRRRVPGRIPVRSAVAGRIAMECALRTAEGHVEHILTKLGFSSRAQIAVWAVEQSRR